MDNQSLICPSCHTIALPGSKFCANCGHILIAPPTSISIVKQIWIYFVSIALPPLGLIWTFRYFKSTYPAVKRVALIALVLTILSSIITIWASVGIFQSVQQQVQQQVNLYQNQGL